MTHLLNFDFLSKFQGEFESFLDMFQMVSAQDLKLLVAENLTSPFAAERNKYFLPAKEIEF